MNEELRRLAERAEGHHDLARFVADALGWESSEEAYPVLCARLDAVTITKAEIVRAVRRINRYA